MKWFQRLRVLLKLVPGAIPAIDCPVVYPYAPNAVLIGFLVSFLGGIVGLLVLGLMNNAGIAIAMILPGVVPHFFCGACRCSVMLKVD